MKFNCIASPGGWIARSGLGLLLCMGLGAWGCSHKKSELGDQADKSLSELTGSTCVAFANNGLSSGDIKLTNVSGGLSNNYPVSLEMVAGTTPFFVMAELTGRISRIPVSDKPTESQRQVLLDLSDSVYLDNEAGFFSIALDPEFATTKTLYASYTIGTSSNIVHVVDRFVGDASYTFSATSGTRILSIPVPNNYHIGGDIAFATDGMLLIGTGFALTDASPDGYAQSLDNLHGKFLRIDVRSTAAQQNANNYIVPSDNPFVNTAGALPEIFAYGLRNPWRFSVDASTGLIWAGDVGASRREEVDLIHSGDNYGWPVREGDLCNPNSTAATGTCTVTNQTEPLFVYSHTDGSCITGGYVYRGSAISSLAGQYIFGDCTAGNVWSINATTAGGNITKNLLATATSGITSFAQDANGELYVLTRDSQVYRLDPTSVADEASLPSKLSASGCGQSDNAFEPPDNVYAYDINVPFWSDGADKERFMALPKNASLALNANGHLDAPTNSVFIKRFTRNDAEVETRLFMRLQDGTWAGFTYAWDANVKDGILVPAAGAVSQLADGTSWRFPSRTECLACHSNVAGGSLGTVVGQFNIDVQKSSGASVNQLSAMTQVGILTGLAQDAIASQQKFISPWDESQTLDLRARTYLHVNCAFCHQPGGNGLGVQDLRLTDQGLSSMKVCNVTPSYGTFGLTNAKLVAPGSADQSIVPVRMLKTDTSRMPTISSDIVDQNGVNLIRDWVNQIASCPTSN